MFGAYSANSRDDVVGDLVAALVPGALGQRVREVLGEDRDRVLARRRHRWVDRRLHVDVQERLVGRPALARVLVGLLHVVDASAR